MLAGVCIKITAREKTAYRISAASDKRTGRLQRFASDLGELLRIKRLRAITVRWPNEARPLKSRNIDRQICRGHPARIGIRVG